MERLLNAIGLTCLQAVIDDVVRALREHPQFSARLSQPEQGQYVRQRQLAFWQAALDSESYRVVMSGLFENLSLAEWRIARALFVQAIQRRVPPLLATQWRQRLDVLEQSLVLR